MAMRNRRYSTRTHLDVKGLPVIPGEHYQYQPRVPSDWRLNTLAIVIIVISLGIAGKADHEAAEMHFKDYCNKVEQGIWPDYDNLQKECDKLKENEEQNNED